MNCSRRCLGRCNARMVRYPSGNRFGIRFHRRRGIPGISGVHVPRNRRTLFRTPGYAFRTPVPPGSVSIGDKSVGHDGPSGEVRQVPSRSSVVGGARDPIRSPSVISRACPGCRMEDGPVLPASPRSNAHRGQRVGRRRPETAFPVPGPRDRERRTALPLPVVSRRSSRQVRVRPNRQFRTLRCP